MNEKPHLVIYPTVITKLFDDFEQYQNELKVYSLNIPHVPRMLSHGEANGFDGGIWTITTNRVKGKPYLDDPSFDASRLATSLAEFHSFSLSKGKCLCHMDNQPKNILLSGNEFFFVDFSDSRVDYPETDVSHLLLFWAEEFTYMEFIAIAGCFLNSYQQIIALDSKRWTKQLKLSISRFDFRRTMFYKKHPSADSPRNRNWLEAVV